MATPSSDQAHTGRLRHIDGLRGLAILLVVGFHAYVRWPESVPYGSAYAGFPLFAYGWLGVHLFFLISGYVIAMTLEKSRGFADFCFRRWSRLFPAMLICSLLAYATASWLYARPAGQPTLLSLLPGITFIEPSWWSRVLGTSFPLLEGAYWSLFVEVKFYVVAAAAFFAFGRRAMLVVLISAWLLSVLSSLLALHGGPALAVPVDKALRYHLSFGQFGWFCAGMLWFYRLQGADRSATIAAWALVIGSAVMLGEGGWPATIAGVCIAAVFVAVLRHLRLQSIFAHPFLVFFGFVSYPLYLIHQNALIAAIAQCQSFTPAMLQPWLPLPITAALAAIAFLIAKVLEPPVQTLLRRAYGRLQPEAKPLAR